MIALTVTPVTGHRRDAKYAVESLSAWLDRICDCTKWSLAQRSDLWLSEQTLYLTGRDFWCSCQVVPEHTRFPGPAMPSTLLSAIAARRMHSYMFIWNGTHGTACPVLAPCTRRLPGACVPVSSARTLIGLIERL